MRWRRFQLAVDRLEHGDQILYSIIIPKPDDAIAVGRQFDGALFVGRDLVRMLAAIELDDELLFGTGEVRDAVADRMLAAEFVVGEAVAEGAPEDLTLPSPPPRAAREGRS